MSHRYRDLIAWQKQATEGFPRSEVYGLTSQARRAAVSVASNIAAGQGPMEIALDLRFIPETGFHSIQEQCSEVRRLLNGLIDSIQARKK